MNAAAATRLPYPEAARALLRDSVLAAVNELLGSELWSDVTMAQVAERAGVSRQTLYNEFGSRRELARAYVMREAESFIALVNDAVLANDEPRAALGAAFEVFLSAAEGHPVVRAIVAADDGDELLALVTTRGGPLLADIIDRLAAILTSRWPGLAITDGRLIAETLVRLAISHAALPSDSARGTAASVVRVLGPYLDGLIGKIALNGS